MSNFLKYIKSKSNPSDERAKYQKDFFGLSLEDSYGYPVKPIVIAHDRKLNIIAVGTKYGFIKLYGLPGIELQTFLEIGCGIKCLLFIEGKGRLLVLSEEEKIHIYEFVYSYTSSKLNQISSFDLMEKLLPLKNVHKDMPIKQKFSISTIAITCTLNLSNFLYIGTNCGEIHLLQLDNFGLIEPFIFSFEDTPLYESYKNLTQSKDKLTSSICNIVALSKDNNESDVSTSYLLISLKNYYIILWNELNKQIITYFNHGKVLESISVNPLYLLQDFPSENLTFVTSHFDGSLFIWNFDFENFQNLKVPIKEDDDYISAMEKKNAVVKTEATQEFYPFETKSNKPITHVKWTTIINRSENEGDEVIVGDDTIIFVGGMPRDGVNGDKNTVTIMSLKNFTVQTTFEVPSKVNDIIVIGDQSADTTSAGSVLLILTEEELLAVDLATGPGFKTIQPPYLVCIHASAITACLYDDNKLLNFGHSCPDLKQSWPVKGVISGDFSNFKVDFEKSGIKEYHLEPEYFVSGHEDGAIRIWDITPTRGQINLLLTYKTGHLFDLGSPADEESIALDISSIQEKDEKDFFKFKSIGVFDPFTDDPRLAITKICLATGVPFATQKGSEPGGRQEVKTVLAIGGASGQIVVIRDLIATLPLLNNPSPDIKASWTDVNLVQNHTDNFVWKGHQPLTRKNNSDPDSIAIITCCQIYPPAACTTLTIDTNTGLLCAGTAHGFFCLDYLANRLLFYKCTLDPNEMISGGDSALSMKKSLKKSLRQSFRRLRKFRKDGNDDIKNELKPAQLDTTRNASFRARASGRTFGASRWGAAINQERSIEARPTAITSPKTSPNPPTAPKPTSGPTEVLSLSTLNKGLVRCAHFSPNPCKSTPTHNQGISTLLWVGINSGRLFAHEIRSSLLVEEGQEEDGPSVERSYRAWKEIQLKHGAPVVYVSLLPECLANFRGDSLTQDGSPHATRLLVVSEEQIKIFSMPHIKPLHKYRLTALEGSLFRKGFVTNFRDPKATQPGFPSLTVFVALTNHGELGVYELNTLKRLCYYQCLRKEDVNGISSLQFLNHGQALYLESPSELRRLSLSMDYTKRLHELKLAHATADPDSKDISEIASQRTLIPTDTGTVHSLECPLTPVKDEAKVAPTMESFLEKSEIIKKVNKPPLPTRSLFRRIIHASHHNQATKREETYEEKVLLKEKIDEKCKEIIVPEDDFTQLLLSKTEFQDAGNDTFYRETRSMLEKGSLAEMRTALIKGKENQDLFETKETSKNGSVRSLASFPDDSKCIVKTPNGQPIDNLHKIEIENRETRVEMAEEIGIAEEKCQLKVSRI